MGSKKQANSNRDLSPFDRIRRRLRTIRDNQGMNKNAKIRAMLECDETFAAWHQTEKEMLIKQVLNE